MTSLIIRLFGPPVVELDGQPIVFETRKALAMLIYLALSPQPVSREFLATLFWPEFSQTQALANLRRNLNSLANSLRGEILEADRQTVFFKETVILNLDIQDFRLKINDVLSHNHDHLETCEKCLQTLEAGILAYRGEFLEGFNLRDCPEFDDWQYQQRQDLQQELRLTLNNHIRQCVAMRRWEKAIISTRRLVALDSLDETSHRKLMWLYAQDNQRKAALHQYEECLETLKEELDQAPEPETIELFENIRDGKSIEFAELQDLHLGVSASMLGEPISSPSSQKDRFIDTVLRTKLLIPSIRKSAVNRPRLITLVNQGVQGALTIVSAPAGFGKTTLLASWAAQSPSLVGWLSLDADDNDPVRFMTYLIMGFKSIQPEMGDLSLEMLTSLQAPPSYAVLTPLLNQVSSFGKDFVIILDDYHVITSEPVQKIVLFLIEHLSPNLHLVIATRSDPLLPLARLRVRSQLVDLRAEDLRFSTEEVANFLNSDMGLNLSPQDVSLIGERTEGWAAGLQMAALSMGNREDKASFIQAFNGTHRYILDYLVEEVLNSQPEFIRIFLMKTSLLDRFCASLCEAFLGSFIDKDGTADSSPVFCLDGEEVQSYQQILNYLERKNMFLVSLDEERRWYRYHHLFADLLRARCWSTNPEQISALYTRAADWCASIGLWREAIQYALQAQDYQLGANLFEQAILTDHRTFLSGSMQPLIAPFPADWVQQRPLLCLAKAIAMDQTSQYDGIETLLLKAEKGILDMPLFETKDELLGRVYITRSIAASIAGDDKRIIEACQKVLYLLPDDTQAKIEALVELGDAYYYEGDLHKVDLYWRQALELSRSIRNDYGTFLSQANLIRLCWHIGELDRGEMYFQGAIQQLARESSRFPRWLVATQREYSEILRERNHLIEACSMMTSCLISGERVELASGQGLGYIHLGKILLAQGDITGARAMLQNAEDYCRKHSIYPDVATLLQTFHTQLCLAEDQLDQAWQIIDTCLGSSYCQHEFQREWAIIAKARLLLRMDHPVDTLTELSGRLDEAKEKGRVRNWLEMLLLMALARFALGDQQQAFSLLETGLIYTQSQGFIRIYLDEGATMQNLLSSGKQKGIWPDPHLSSYVDRLLAEFIN